MQAIGVRCIIAVSFGDIFYGNCFQNGVLALRLPLDQVAEIARMSLGGEHFTVDLMSSVITSLTAVSGLSHSRICDAKLLIEGLDPIALTLKRRDTIDDWERAEAAIRPWNCLIDIEG